jgi:hypothetical protein
VIVRVAAVALLVLAGCGAEGAGEAEDESVGTASYAVNGTYDIRNCTPAQALQAQIALESIRTMLNNGKLQACLLNGVFGAYHEPTQVWPHWVPGYPEPLLRRLRTDPTILDCADGSTAVIEGEEHVFISRGWFGAAPPFGNEQMANLTGNIAHELAHTKGYSDAPLWIDPRGNPENPHIASEQMSGCAYAIHSTATNDLQTKGVLRATDLAPTGEALLVQAGAYGGGPNPQLQCPYNEFAVGLNGRASDNVDALGLQCSTTTLSPQGGPGGGVFSLRCGTGETLVGVHGRADVTLQRIGPICGVTSQVNAGTLSDLGDDDGIGGGDPNHYFRRLCPAGHAVKGIRIRSGAIVDRIQLMCQRRNAPRSVVVRSTSRTSGTGGTSDRMETCPSRSAMYRLVTDFHPTHGVARLSGGCKPVSTTVQNGTVTVSAAPARLHVVQGVGNAAFQDGIDWTQDDCNGLLVGVSVQTDGWMRRIRGRCVTDPVRWSQQQSVTISNLSWRGTATDPGKPIETRDCNPGEFLVGFKRQERRLDGFARSALPSVLSGGHPVAPRAPALSAGASLSAAGFAIAMGAERTMSRIPRGRSRSRKLSI